MSTDAIAMPSAAIAPRPIVAGLPDWVTTVDHKRLGILYITFAMAYLLIAGVEAMIIRIQLIRPHNDFVSPQVFNRLFTMHGTTMIFFVIMPVLFGFANYLIPLMIGARDMAFPRLNAFSFWMTAFGAMLLYFSLVGANGLYGAGNAPDVGWFAYAPLTSQTFSVGHSTDFWTLALLVSGFGSIGTAINIVATVLCMRCPGMTLAKLPLFAWLNLVMAGLVILCISPLTAAQIMLVVDRYLGGHFFDTQAGGSAVIWMHFFWVFGHPEVYVLVLPAFAFSSKITPVSPRKPIFGYSVMVGATVTIGFISMSVWAHHMFTVGMSSAANNFFVISTMAIAVPTGIKIFNWLATMWGGKIEFKTPMLFCIAFLFQFLIAGLTGVMQGAAPFDWHLGNSYFVVAHFHYVIVGGILFCLFGAFYYWFPKMTGKMYSETLGKLHFWLFFIGFHLTFDFMHIPGLLGMPRRIYTYEPGRGWDTWNFIVTVGVFFQAAGILAFLGNLAWSYLWAQQPGAIRGTPGHSSGPRIRRLLPITSHQSRSSRAAALSGTLSIRLILTGIMNSGESVMNAASMTVAEARIQSDRPDRGRIGMLSLIAAEAAIFTIFVVAYIFYVGKSLAGPMPRDVLSVPVFYTICLLSSSLTIHLAAKFLREGNVPHFAILWLATIVLGTTFMYGTATEWHRLIYQDGFTISTNLFGTTYYSLVGLHGFHVLVGLVSLSIVMALTLLGSVQQEHAKRVDVLSLYWHFVDVVWIVVFTVVYVIGR